MRRKSWINSVAAATPMAFLSASLALSPNSAAGGEQAKLRTTTVSPYAYPMGNCRIGNLKPRKSDVALIVRVVVTKDSDYSNPVRNVKYKLPSADDSSEDTSDEIDDGSDNIDYSGSPFGLNVDLSRIVNADTKYAMIRIVLRDSDKFKFFEDSTFKGVYGSSRNPRFQMCGAHVRQKRNPSAVFYVKMKAGTGTNAVYESFNILLDPLLHPGSTLIIDPKVGNNG